MIIFKNFTVIGNKTYSDLSILLSNDLILDEIFFMFVLFISFISQIGDLLISYFKRLAMVKDTGNILPGHGGLLDRVDGIILAMTTTYLLILYLK